MSVVPGNRPRVSKWLVATTSAIAAAAIFSFVLRYHDQAFIPMVLRWWASPTREDIQRREAPPARTPLVRATVTPPRPLGTDSSVLAQPAPLILVATHVGRNPREGTAELGVNRLTPQTYSAGALLANGARLSEVNPQYVVLTKGDLSERLYVAGTAGQAGPTPSLAMVGGAVGNSSETADAHAQPSSLELSDVLRPSPTYSGNEVTGLAVYPGRVAGLFGPSGLRAGDEITEINGMAIRSVADALTGLTPLIQGDSVGVAVRRGGETVRLTLDGSGLSRPAAHSGT